MCMARGICSTHRSPGTILLGIRCLFPETNLCQSSYSLQRAYRAPWHSVPRQGCMAEASQRWNSPWQGGRRQQAVNPAFPFIPPWGKPFGGCHPQPEWVLSSVNSFRHIQSFANYNQRTNLIPHTLNPNITHLRSSHHWKAPPTNGWGFGGHLDKSFNTFEWIIWGNHLSILAVNLQQPACHPDWDVLTEWTVHSLDEPQEAMKAVQLWWSAGHRQQPNPSHLNFWDSVPLPKWLVLHNQ